VITGGAVIIMRNDVTGRNLCVGGGWDTQRHDTGTSKKTDEQATHSLSLDQSWGPVSKCDQLDGSANKFLDDISIISTMLQSTRDHEERVITRRMLNGKSKPRIGSKHPTRLTSDRGVFLR